MSTPKDKTEMDPAPEATAGEPIEAPVTQDGRESAPEPTDPLEVVTAERDRLHNQLQRTLADLQNFRKRRAQEMADVRQNAIEALTTELLPVLDNFHLATSFGDSAGEAAVKSLQDGLTMVKGMLESVFERHGVREIPAEGERFDPNVHEAVGIDPDPEAEKDVVTQVLQKGYRIDNRVIRPTRVMVGGGAPRTADEDAPRRGEEEEGES